MLKVTADTNILISASIAKGNEFELLRLAKLNKIQLILSPQILKEYKEVISRPKFGFSEVQIESALKQILRICSLVMPSIKINAVIEDPDDNMILECAVTGKVGYIVSGDKHLLDLKEFENIKIVTTASILKLI